MFSHIETILLFSLTIFQSFIIVNFLNSQFNIDGILPLIISIILSFCITCLELSLIHKVMNKK